MGSRKGGFAGHPDGKAYQARVGKQKWRCHGDGEGFPVFPPRDGVQAGATGAQIPDFP